MINLAWYATLSDKYIRYYEIPTGCALAAIQNLPPWITTHFALQVAPPSILERLLPSSLQTHHRHLHTDMKELRRLAATHEEVMIINDVSPAHVFFWYMYPELTRLWPLICEAFVSSVFDDQLADNACKLFQNLSVHSPLRLPILRTLCKLLTGKPFIEELQKRLDVSRLNGHIDFVTMQIHQV